MPPFGNLSIFNVGSSSPYDPTPQQSLLQALLSQQGAGSPQGQGGPVFNSTPLVTGLFAGNQGGNLGGAPGGAAQPQTAGLASAVGTGLRNLFNGAMGSNR